MRGDQHVLITLFSGGLLLAPHLSSFSPGEAAVLLFGLFIGSLAPDADATDAAIFHTQIRGLSGASRRFVNGAARILPFFGYLIRYGEYYPAAGLFWLLSGGRLRAGHRGILHSLIGVVVITALTSAYLLAVLFLIGRAPDHLLAYALAGFAAGACLHLAEDSCTPAGIAWLYPVSGWRLRGRLRSGGRTDHRPRVFATALGCSMWGCLLLQHHFGAAAETMVHLSVFLFCLLWALFYLVARS
ncbi:LexA-binding, inner membrane-associated putative hydrolase [anaerobic digester metagenome]